MILSPSITKYLFSQFWKIVTLPAVLPNWCTEYSHRNNTGFIIQMAFLLWTMMNELLEFYSINEGKLLFSLRESGINFWGQLDWCVTLISLFFFFSFHDIISFNPMFNLIILIYWNLFIQSPKNLQIISSLALLESVPFSPDTHWPIFVETTWNSEWRQNRDHIISKPICSEFIFWF